MSKARLEAFSDGVFAIAITLLVLSLAQPASTADLGRELLDQWPGYAAYGVSFVVIGIMWINHHALFLRLASTDRVLQFLNLVLLMGVAFLPYPTGLVGRALQQGHGEVAAAAMYSAVNLFIAFGFTAVWSWSALGRRLLVPSFPAGDVAGSIVRFGIGIVAYSVLLVLAFVSPVVCLVGHGVVAMYYVVDQLTGGRTDAAEAVPGES